MHEIDEILEVRLEPNLDLNMIVGSSIQMYQNNQNHDTSYLVTWKCKCCNDGKRKNEWFKAE